MENYFKIFENANFLKLIPFKLEIKSQKLFQTKITIIKIIRGKYFKMENYYFELIRNANFLKLIPFKLDKSGRIQFANY